MSRPPSSAQRNLTLTEELEKLEQSITLTLQEIDSNFSRAHRIVTTSILPLVEQYAEHSRDVWEGSKFWKQFFEASANVSLSGYEDQPNDETIQDQTAETVTTTEEGESATDATHSTLNHPEGHGEADEAASYETPSSAQQLDISSHEGLLVDHAGGQEVDISGLSISPSHSSTPRAPTARYQRTGGAGPSTPSTPAYGDVTSQLEGTQPRSMATPGKSARKQNARTADDPDMLMSSPFVDATPQSAFPLKKSANNQRPNNPVLHHVLDKTYRVQATPLSKGFGHSRSKFPATPKNQSGTRFAFDDSPLSSPELEAPKLHEEIFASPFKDKNRTPAGRKARPVPGSARHARVTPQPGVSVLTPGKAPLNRRAGGWGNDDDDVELIGYDEEDDEGLDVSPPKTMQFHIPQSRLMKTPAKEASKRIVSDLLATAGGGDDLTDDHFGLEGTKPGYGHEAGEEYSPTVVRRAAGLEDETF